MVRRYVLALGVLVCFFVPLVAEIDEQDVGKLVDAFFASYAQGEVKSVASLFHFPRSQSAAARDKDAGFVIAAMRGFLREFGTTGEREETTYQEPSYDFRVNAGSEEYWVEHYDIETRKFRTTFSKAGGGYVLFGFCSIGGELEIAFVRFALPDSNPEAESKFTTLRTLVLSLMDSVNVKTGKVNSEP